MAEIRWFGHNCFRIRAREATVMTDPVGKNTGYSMGRQTADIVTLSHQHPGHTNLAAIKGEHVVLDGPGEYELHGVFLFGHRSYHDKAKGAELGYNTMFRMTLDGLAIGHLGDLGHSLDDTQIEEMEDLDILFVPAGGGPLLGPAEMADVVGNLSPKIVIPMQYRAGSGDRDREDATAFARQLSLELPEPVDKLVLKSSDVGDSMRLLTLVPER